MVKFINLALLTLLIIGCTSKTYVHEPLKNELLAYTQKFEHIRDNSDRYLAVATYLNPALNDTQNPSFVNSS
ncbi:MAG: hypothetical protein GXZ15_04400 [Campylobacter sp.]|nr:hypothetical protein [Campylobacter sp.]